MEAAILHVTVNVSLNKMVFERDLKYGREETMWIWGSLQAKRKIRVEKLKR